MADPLGVLHEFYETHVKTYGTGIAGALVGCGWWALVDAVYLPGFAAMFALVLINAVRLDELSAVDPWDDEGVFCRSRIWLLIAYLVCGGAIAGATVVMLASGGSGIGLAVVIQVACILGGALLFFVSRSQGDAGDGSYGLL